MGPLANLDLGVLAGFSAAALFVSAGAVFISGFFPRAARPEAVAGGLGGLLLWLGVALTALIAVLAVAVAAARLDWAVAVVAAGSAFLLAPFLVQPVPERIRDTKAGLGLFAVLGCLVLVALPADSLF
ncbi:hypothetical protein LNKW23_16220 [Paralimibaculum aggregatum]|uniref:Uncharacterized protein n=1 Tax=Paralimibaculum aggregatum TaxID=3036245 RepID=A0ABQ6LP57_9RHOB|nr:hypothetical protein [Limibaculum sp. NKW23]GMG82409.1 hypothetical protein LNKW23_16220 [Limibaculum sp. NKW23]